jgi:hypothetical protein
MTNRHRAPGSVFLASSGADLGAMAARAIAAAGAGRTDTPLRVAVSYAPMADAPGGLAHMKGAAQRTFGGSGISLEAFAVEGEPHAMAPREAHAIVARADLVFVTGGDPVLGARILAAAGADAWLREAHARGASMLGVSAGAMVLAARWASWPDPDENPEAARGPFDGGTLVPCAAVADRVVVDCHAEKDAWAELVLVRDLLVAEGTALADIRFEGARATLPPRGLALVGLPLGCGLVVHPSGELEAPLAAPYVLPPRA